MHAAVVLKNKIDIRSCTRLDIVFEGKTYHGDYQAMKGTLLQAVSYCTKHDTDPFLHNLNLKALAQASKSKKKFISKEVMEGKALAKCIEENPEHLFDFHNWQKSTQSYKLSVEEPYEAKGCRGLWLWGKPNTGKTHYARELSRKQFGKDAYMKAQNKWFDGYIDEPVIIIDDLDETFAIGGLTNRLKIWADKYGCTGEVKGSMIPLHHQLLIVTSNMTPYEIWPDAKQRPHLNAILSRFTVKKFDKVRDEPRPKCDLLEHITKQLFENTESYEPMIGEKVPELKRAKVERSETVTELLATKSESTLLLKET